MTINHCCICDDNKAEVAKMRLLLTKAHAVIDDMRMVDLYNSRVGFDAEDFLKELTEFLFTPNLSSPPKCQEDCTSS